jgi:hypothetical protein
MTTWIILAAVYVVGLLVLRRLGGFGSAGQALRDWGGATSATRSPQSVSQSA